MKNSDLNAILKRVVELVMPDLRSYYRIVRKARVVKVYASDGQYWADVQPLRNDDSVDEKEAVIPKAEIPILWAGQNRGVVCPPVAGAYCDLEYYDGDPNYPRISNFRWHGHGAPECELEAFIIQKESGVYIKIEADNKIIHMTSGDQQSGIGGNKSENIDGDVSTNIGGAWTIIADGTVTIQAPSIVLNGALSAGGAGANLISGDLNVDGNIQATGTIIDSGGNTNHHSH
ncbi:MAG: baseplate assembly protein [Desulfobacterales bacterium]|nr:baseplate assembly protein [Desulfobacterales bacterium]